MSGLRIKAGPRLKRLLESRGTPGSAGAGRVVLGGRGGGVQSFSGGVLIGSAASEVFVRAIVTAVNAPGGGSAPALPSEVTYDVRAIGREDIAPLTGIIPEWRTVRNDEVPIWPRPVGSKGLLVEWPDAASQRRWLLFLPEAIAFYDCEAAP